MPWASHRRWPPAPGFETRPNRHVVATLLLLVLVVAASAGFAHIFRETALWTIERYAGSADPTTAAASMRSAAVAGIVTTAVVISVALAKVVLRRWSTRIGLEAVAASARGEPRPLSLPATIVRSAATWLVAAGLVSIGRESAIIETGGALGGATARRWRGRGDAMAAAGAAAAFAAAYHAPIAALFYLHEHLGVGRSRRALLFAAAGAAGGHVMTVTLFDGRPVFPGTQGPRLEMLALALLCLLPPAGAARAFLQVRNRLIGATSNARLRRWHWQSAAVLAAVAGIVVAVSARTAGNGMEALRHASTTATVGVAVALAVGKLAGTAAALAAGVPGGVLTPTMSIAAGWALLTALAAEGLGVGVAHPWDVMVAAMAVGVAVGMRSPLVAVFLVPELLGDLTLVPVIAAVVAAAVVLDRGIDRLVRRRGTPLPVGVHDEDA